MSVRKITKKQRVAFRDEMNYEIVKWEGYEEDIAAAGFPIDAVVKKLKGSVDISIETDGKEFTCKIYAVHHSAYSSKFIGGFVRFFTNPEAGITSLPIDDWLAYSIFYDRGVEVAHEEIAKVIVRHCDESSSETRWVRHWNLLKRKLNWVTRIFKYHIISLICSFVSFVFGLIVKSLF